MKQLAGIFAAMAIALTLTACQQMADTHDNDVKALQKNEAQWNDDFASKDANRLVAHYAEDAVLMSPGTPPAVGTDAIRNTLTKMVSDPALSLKFHPSKIEVAKAGDLAYTQGSYIVSFTDPQTRQVVNDHGSYVTTYRKQADGAWKAVADIASSEMPAMGVPKQ